MQLPGAPQLGHLTYCTNIHAGESWPEVFAGLQRHLPAIKQAVAPVQPLGVGLRLSAEAALALEDPEALGELRAFLEAGGYYVFTLNGFPYGTFHGAPVKEQVYRPDWSDPARLDYSNRLADILAALLPEGLDGSVSTVPGTFKAWADEACVNALTDNLIRHVAHLVTLREASGKLVTLALEPEPCCLLETVAETVAFFEQRLFGPEAAARPAALSGLSVEEARKALHRHLGVCYDVCHAAVEFEEPRAAIARLRAAGISVFKVQLSAALKLAPVTAAGLAQLRPFDEPVYLHQTVAQSRDGLTRYVDLPEALEQGKGAVGQEWRTHFHVPIFLEAMEHFDTTQDVLREVLALHRESPICAQLEVETYTWDVLPEHYRRVEVSAAIARELAWVKDRLAR